MMKKEFETLAGYEVTEKDYYKIIEPMYLATDLSKQDFIKTIDKKRFALENEKQPLKVLEVIKLSTDIDGRQIYFQVVGIDLETGKKKGYYTRDCNIGSTHQVLLNGYMICDENIKLSLR